MTALAGYVGTAGIEPGRECARILRAQGVYGRGTEKIAAIGSTAFGIDLRANLPEDRFDQQPLVSEGQVLLVADVRIDNREEVLAALGLRGGESADSAILFHSWMRWGAPCLQRIVGDYALAVWDERERRLTLARDATGQRPLFYASRDGLLAFASTPAGLLACAGVRFDYDFHSLARAAVGLTNRSETAYFRGIARVPPGHIIHIRPDGVSSERHWMPPTESVRLRSDAEYVEAYREHLNQAVRARVRRAGGELGVHLSSGWDSSAVAAIAARVAGKKPVAFTSAPRAGFNGPVPRGRIADESKLAELVARKLELEQVIVRPSGGVLSRLREHCRIYQDPVCNLVNLEWLAEILDAAAARRASTLLTGEMGNLSLHAGGLPVLAEWLRAGAFAKWWKQARAARASGQARWQGILMNSFAPWLPESVAGVASRVFMGTPSLQEQNFFRSEWLTAPSAPSIPVRRYRGPYAARFHAITASDPGLFRKGALAYAGVDERDPTADRRLLDFSFALPPEQLLYHGTWRPLARKALRGILPDEILNSRLRGYQGADWYERVKPEDASAVLEEISSSHSACELLDIPKIRKAIDDWPQGAWANPREIAIYRSRLPIALAAGVFVKEFEGAVRGSSAG